MDMEENKRLVMEGYRLFQAGDITQLLTYFHDDAEWIAPEAEAIPFAGSFHGKAEVARFFSELGAAVEPTRFDIRDVIAENDKVVVTGEATWRVKANGLSYDNPWVDVFTLRDGKVIRIEAYFDTAPAERAFHPDRPDLGAAATELRH